MDEQTISAYDAACAKFAQDWREQPAPDDLYALLRAHFRPGPTVDIGCGSGRDVAWLAANGYDACGYDASAGLLRQAEASYPGLRFGLAILPGLDGIAAGAYENVLCETVIMHLEPRQVGPAVRRLLGLLRPGGTLFLSWRVTEDDSMRDKNGRLYAAFDKRVVIEEIAAWPTPMTALLDQEDVNLSSGRKVHRLIVRRGPGSPEEQALP